mmetsp:Transcript_12285/g.30253  ORF Transcript_12285/g.30253 Transcript_12285/m.30253 type:complete len:211 (-) Transcript_12285:721-1353(-)
MDVQFVGKELLIIVLKLAKCKIYFPIPLLPIKGFLRCCGHSRVCRALHYVFIILADKYSFYVWAPIFLLVGFNFGNLNFQFCKRCNTVSTSQFRYVRPNPLSSSTSSLYRRSSVPLPPEEMYCIVPSFLVRGICHQNPPTSVAPFTCWCPLIRKNDCHLGCIIGDSLLIENLPCNWILFLRYIRLRPSTREAESFMFCNLNHGLIQSFSR